MSSGLTIGRLGRELVLLLGENVKDLRVH